MPDFNIIPLGQRPELADVCAAWSFGQWGCQIRQKTLERVVEGYRETCKDESKPPVTWICLADEKPTGMIRLKMDDHPDHPELFPWLASLFVHPWYRKKGIASMLCRHVEKEAEHKYNFDKLYLFTPDAESLYERLGWKKIGTVRDPAGHRKDGEPLMMKML